MRELAQQNHFIITMHKQAPPKMGANHPTYDWQNYLSVRGVNMCWKQHRDHEYVVLVSAVLVTKMFS